MRQLDGNAESPPASTWMWLTSLRNEAASSEVVIEVAHSRWSIENEGFNELANHWHADHIYRHAPDAVVNFWLMCMVAYNVFRAFFERNLKAALREGKTMLHFARMIGAELYAGSRNPPGVPP